MSIGGNSKSVPATEGVEFGSDTISASSGSKPIFGGNLESRSIIILADLDNDNPVFLGWDDGVSPSNGIKLSPGASLSIDLDVSEQNVFIATGSGTQAFSFASTR